MTRGNTQTYEAKRHSAKVASVEKKPLSKADLDRKLDMLQLRVSLSILLGLFGLNLLPYTLKYAKPFFSIDGQIGLENSYKVSSSDTGVIFTSVTAIIFVRVFVMNFIIRPFCTHVLGIKSEGAKQRFVEQGWAFFLYTMSFLWGFKIFYLSEYFTNLDYIYKDLHEQPLTWECKFNYLVSLANWLSQVFTLNIEKKRKDHFQMFTHHIITILLVGGSYVFGFTRIGNLIMVIMDFVDIWLAFAKILKYCGFSNACDFTFLIFFFSWIALRHGLYNYLVYFTYTNIWSLLGNSLCENNSTDAYCVPSYAIDVFIGLLVALQMIMMVWMYMILKVLYKIISGNGAEDVRSDSEDEDDDEQEVTEKLENIEDEKYPEKKDKEQKEQGRKKNVDLKN